MPESVGRMELFARLGRITVAEAMVNEAANYTTDLAWRHRQGERDTTSVYASRFPGGARSCERQIVYDLMNFANTEAMPPMVGATAIVGKAVEEYEVNLLDAAGRLLSPGADAEDQIRVEDADHWISGRPDIVTLPPFWNRPLLVEKKTKDGDVVDEMRALRRPYDPSHAYQTRVYIAILREISRQLWPAAVVCKHTWRLAEPGNKPVIDAMICRDHGINDDCGCLIEIELEPIQSGVLSYSSRNRPNVRASWYFEHDDAWWQKGLAVLRRAQEAYATDQIPAHPFGGKQWASQPCQWCVDPDSQILCADLIWRRAGDLVVGQQIIGFDEHSNGTSRRRYRPSVVQSHETIARPCLAVDTEIGSTIVSIDHQFLIQPVRGRDRRRRFVRADELQVGDQIAAFGSPWRSSPSYEAGWLAGLFDGEGTLSARHVSVAQRPGAVLEQAKTLLSSFGFEWTELHNVNGNSALGNPCSRLRVGTLYEQLRLLGTIRPTRLLAKADVLWDGAATWSQVTRNARVLEISDVGEAIVVAMETSTSTYISDGLLSHNCPHKRNTCKPDQQAGVTKLTESHGVEWSRDVYGRYDVEAIRRAVLDRWAGREGLGYSLPPGYEIGRYGVQRTRSTVAA